MSKNNDLCAACPEKGRCQAPCEAYRALYGTPRAKKLNLYQQAVRTFGIQSQTLKAAEEMTELAKELIKFVQYGYDPEILDHIKEEMADVAIMVEQLKVIFGENQRWEIVKLKHLEELVNNPENAKKPRKHS